MWAGIFGLLRSWLTLGRDVEELRTEVRRLRELHNETVVEFSEIRADIRRVEQEFRHRDELLAARVEQLAEKCSVPPPPALLPVRRRRR